MWCVYVGVCVMIIKVVKVIDEDIRLYRLWLALLLYKCQCVVYVCVCVRVLVWVLGDHGNCIA